MAACHDGGPGPTEAKALSRKRRPDPPLTSGSKALLAAERLAVLPRTAAFATSVARSTLPRSSPRSSRSTGPITVGTTTTAPRHRPPAGRLQERRVVQRRNAAPTLRPHAGEPQPGATTPGRARATTRPGSQRRSDRRDPGRHQPSSSGYLPPRSKGVPRPPAHATSQTAAAAQAPKNDDHDQVFADARARRMGTGAAGRSSCTTSWAYAAAPRSGGVSMKPVLSGHHNSQWGTEQPP